MFQCLWEIKIVEFLLLIRKNLQENLGSRANKFIVLSTQEMIRVVRKQCSVHFKLWMLIRRK